METKKFTLREFIDNIEKNGLPQAFGGLFKDNQGFIDIGGISNLEIADATITHACALGQGYINTGIYPFIVVEDYYDDIIPQDIQDTIVRMNDTGHESFKYIAETLRVLYNDRLDDVYEGIIVEYKTAQGEAAYGRR